MEQRLPGRNQRRHSQGSWSSRSVPNQFLLAMYRGHHPSSTRCSVQSSKLAVRVRFPSSARILPGHGALSGCLASVARRRIRPGVPQNARSPRVSVPVQFPSRRTGYVETSGPRMWSPTPRPGTSGNTRGRVPAYEAAQVEQDRMQTSRGSVLHRHDRTLAALGQEAGDDGFSHVRILTERARQPLGPATRFL